MNKKQEEYLLYLIAWAISTVNPRKRDQVEAYITDTFNKLGETDDE